MVDRVLVFGVEAMERGPIADAKYYGVDQGDRPEEFENLPAVSIIIAFVPDAFLGHRRRNIIIYLKIRIDLRRLHEMASRTIGEIWTRILYVVQERLMQLSQLHI